MGQVQPFNRGREGDRLGRWRAFILGEANALFWGTKKTTGVGTSAAPLKGGSHPSGTRPRRGMAAYTTAR